MSKLKLFTVVNDNDANDTFTVEAVNLHEALAKALEALGWWVAKGDDVDADDAGNCEYCGQKCWEGGGQMCDEQQAGGFNNEK